MDMNFSDQVMPNAVYIEDPNMRVCATIVRNTDDKAIILILIITDSEERLIEANIDFGKHPAPMRIIAVEAFKKKISECPVCANKNPIYANRDSIYANRDSICELFHDRFITELTSNFKRHFSLFGEYTHRDRLAKFRITMLLNFDLYNILTKQKIFMDSVENITFPIDSIVKFAIEMNGISELTRESLIVAKYITDNIPLAQFYSDLLFDTRDDDGRFSVKKAVRNTALWINSELSSHRFDTEDVLGSID